MRQIHHANKNRYVSNMASHFPDDFPDLPVEEQKRILIEVIGALPVEQIAELCEMIDLVIEKERTSTKERECI